MKISKFVDLCHFSQEKIPHNYVDTRYYIHNSIRIKGSVSFRFSWATQLMSIWISDWLFEGMPPGWISDWLIEGMPPGWISDWLIEGMRLWCRFYVRNWNAIVVQDRP